ncbi:MAG: hypothetical protein HKN52_02590, partial [Eudoraea sp.]|nr:hypothetical protein [Muriicola sp.]NNE02028.1 hypothetical protein [Eudoraea sp.]
MNTQVIYNEDLHLEHKQWNMELNFWRDELKTFKNRLEELVQKWTEVEVLASLDHFQNQFLIHRTKIMEMKERIEMHELNMSRHYEANENVMDRFELKNHIALRERMETERQMYHELKKEFYAFLTKLM